MTGLITDLVAAGHAIRQAQATQQQAARDTAAQINAARPRPHQPPSAHDDHQAAAQ